MLGIALIFWQTDFLPFRYCLWSMAHSSWRSLYATSIWSNMMILRILTWACIAKWNVLWNAFRSLSSSIVEYRTENDESRSKEVLEVCCAVLSVRAVRAMCTYARAAQHFNFKIFRRWFALSLEVCSIAMSDAICVLREAIVEDADDFSSWIYHGAPDRWGEINHSQIILITKMDIPSSLLTTIQIWLEKATMPSWTEVCSHLMIMPQSRRSIL
jgi:hypothetical protein